MKLQPSYKICIAYLLVSQGLVHATMSIIDSFGSTVDDFTIRYATAISFVMEGYIDYADPSDACSEIGPPNFPHHYTMKKIVLINGTSTCDFMTKIQNAKAAGFDIAVLFDPIPGPFDYPNKTLSEVDLSVVLLLLEDGIVIRNNYLYHNSRDKEKFIVRINANLTWWLLLFVIAGVTIFGFIAVVLIIGIFVIFFTVLGWIWFTCADLFQNRNRHNHNEVHVPEPLIRAELNIMNQENDGNKGTEEQRNNALRNLRRRFPSEEFSQAHPFDVCVICMCNFEVGEFIRVLRCSHAYHSECIDAWVLQRGIKATCPMCVAKVNSVENSCEHSPSDSTETTRLLISTHVLYSASRTSNGSGPLDAAYVNPFHSTDQSGELLAGARGSVNYVHLNESDEEDQWFDA